MNYQEQPQPFHKVPQLGKLLTNAEPRDAVHIAIIPMIAHRKLNVGERIGVDATGKVTADPVHITSGNVPVIGIVDPYLSEPVPVKAMFWLFLMPGAVTSLRHEWDHLAFPPGHNDPKHQRTDELLMVRKSDKTVSQSWLRQYAARVNSHDSGEGAYESLIRGLKEKMIVYHGTDMHSRGDLIDAEELQYHAQIVLNEKIDFGEFEFSCSC